jgi:predicted dehydrogenase
MIGRQSRRRFLKNTAVAAGAFAGVRLFGAPNILADAKPNSKLGIAVVGTGGQGTGAHVPPASRERLIALVDADDKKLDGALKKAAESNKDLKTDEVKRFNDYRKMFDEVGKDIDGIIVATPNHHHCLPALMAMKLGKGAYVEKPMCWSVQEARMMAEWSKKYKVATQMGNQGHCGEHYRLLCEYVAANSVGPIKEVHCWSDRSNGGVGPRPPTKPVPSGFHWDEWIGPAPFREYHADLHPHEWHGWYDFGDGSIGNMGCHVMDGAVWALNLKYPTSMEIEEIGGGSEERYPTGCRIRYDFPARGEMPAVKLYWYDGKRKGLKSVEKGDAEDNVAKGSQNLPPLHLELEKKYGKEGYAGFGQSNGSLYVGEKGLMFTGCYGSPFRVVPEELHKQIAVPPKTVVRVKGGPHGDYFNGIRTGTLPCSNFEVASALTEIVVLGCLATRAGLGKKLEYDGPNMKFTNAPEFTKFLSRENRKGWEA